MTLPTHDEMVANIITVYERATFGQTLDGADWYRRARFVIEDLSNGLGVDPHRFAHALAALSPRNPWRWNVQDAYAFASAAHNGAPMPGNATTFKRNCAAAWAALTNGGDPWKTAALKVRSFVAACLGDPEAVVIDVWAYRVAVGCDMDKKVNKSEYKAITAAYAEAAMQVGRMPAHLQAITWLVVRGEGRNKVRSYKAGTAEAVIAAMENA